MALFHPHEFRWLKSFQQPGNWTHWPWQGTQRALWSWAPQQFGTLEPLDSRKSNGDQMVIKWLYRSTYIMGIDGNMMGMDGNMIGIHLEYFVGPVSYSSVCPRPQVEALFIAFEYTISIGLWKKTTNHQCWITHVETLRGAQLSSRAEGR